MTEALRTRKVRIGFIGVGSMGQCAHLKNYVVLSDCEVVALAEPRPKLREAVARRYGVPRTYATGEEMVERESLDALVAAQPFHRHATVILPLYRYGLPIFTEKPLAATVEIGERMLEALRTGGSWHMVGYHKRSDPATVWAKTEIERLRQTGELGPLKYVRITTPPGDWTAGGFDDLIRTDEPYPAGPADLVPDWKHPHFAFVNYYIHQVNLLRFLLAEPYRVTFVDRAGVLLVAESVSGITGVIEMAPYQTTTDWQESALVTFAKGYVRVQLPAPLACHQPGRVEVFRDPGNGATPQTAVPHLPPIHAMRQQAIHFVRAVRGEMRPPCEAAEALEDLRIAQDYLQMAGKAWRGSLSAGEPAGVSRR